MTSELISINYKKALVQADRLEQIADNLKNMSERDFEQILQTVNNNWKGENASKYLKTGNELELKMSATAKELKKTAEVIRTIAKNWYDAEMAAIAIAQTRMV